jgi:hypothetical protein
MIKYSQCSQCGRIAEDDTQACKHVRFFKNNYFYDPNGEKRIIAELCGRSEDPDSCKFMDASWVRKPAFEGAVLRNILDVGSDSQDVSEKLKNVINIPSFIPQEGMLLKAASEAASNLVTKIAQEGDAPAPPAEGGGEDSPPAPAPDTTDFPAPSGDTPPLTTDTPPAEGDAPATDTPEEPSADVSSPDAAPGGIAAPGADLAAPPAQEPVEDATVKEVRTMIEKQVLNKLRKELLNEGAPAEERPHELENEVNESLFHDASDLTREATFRKVLSSAKRYSNKEKFINGLHILSNIKDWDQMKKYGYTRDDVLGLLYHIDRTASKTPVGSDVVKALSKIKLASGNLKGFFTEIIVETGRQPNTKEAKKLAGWGKILSYFD